MLDWNVVVTLHRSFHRGIHLLRQFGAVARTGLYNVVVMRVPDGRRLLEEIAELPASHELFATVSRIAPVTHRFAFATADELERKARELLFATPDELAGKRLHVRIHRRGHKGEVHAHELEKRLGTAVLEELARRGTPGAFALDDPDVVIAIETVHDEAGLARWTHADFVRYPLLRRSVERGRRAADSLVHAPAPS